MNNSKLGEIWLLRSHVCVAEEDVVEAKKQARLLERDASKCGFLPDLNAGSQSRMEGIEGMRCVLREVKDGHTHTHTHTSSSPC